MLNYTTIFVSISVLLLSNLSARKTYAKSVVLIGGNLQDVQSGDESGTAIYRKIIELSEEAEEAKVGIFTTASISKAIAQEKAEKYAANFNDSGVTDVEWIPFHIENCASEQNSQAIASLIKTRTVLFFGGGLTSHNFECFFEQQADGRFDESLVAETIRHAHDSGAVIAGNSAGAMIQTGSPLIEGGESYQALVSGALESSSQSNLQRPPEETLAPVSRQINGQLDRRQLLGAAMSLRYSQRGGLGFFPYGPVDTHFSERGRQGSLIRFSSDTNQPLSFGIDENTALVVTDSGTPDAVMSVVGDGGVSIFDLRQSEVDSVNGFWSIVGVNMSYLTQGDSFKSNDKSIDFASWKVPFASSDQPMEIAPSNNIFSSLGPSLRRLMSVLTLCNSADIVKSVLSDRPNEREFITIAFSLFESPKTSVSSRTFESDPVTYVVRLSEKDSEGSQGLIGRNSLGKEIVSFKDLIVQIAPETDVDYDSRE